MPLPRISLLSAALLLAGASAGANAADLMQAYTLARDSDPQLAIAWPDTGVPVQLSAKDQAGRLLAEADL